MLSGTPEERLSSMQTIYDVLLSVLKLYAPYAPHITEEIYKIYFAQFEKKESIHQLQIEKLEELSSSESLALEDAEYLIAAISAIRQGKSQRQIGFKVVADKLVIETSAPGVAAINKFLPVLKNFASAQEIKVSTENQISDIWPSPKSDTRLQIIYPAVG